MCTLITQRGEVLGLVRILHQRLGYHMIKVTYIFHCGYILPVHTHRGIYNQSTDTTIILVLLYTQVVTITRTIKLKPWQVISPALYLRYTYYLLFNAPNIALKYWYHSSLQWHQRQALQPTLLIRQSKRIRPNLALLLFLTLTTTLSSYRLLDLCSWQLDIRTLSPVLGNA